MEMFADNNARGGVLEAEGLVSIKLRMKEQRAIMERLDPEIKRLKSLPTGEVPIFALSSWILKQGKVNWSRYK